MKRGSWNRISWRVQVVCVCGGEGGRGGGGGGGGRGGGGRPVTKKECDVPFVPRLL